MLPFTPVNPNEDEFILNKGQKRLINQIKKRKLSVIYDDRCVGKTFMKFYLDRYEDYNIYHLSLNSTPMCIRALFRIITHDYILGFIPERLAMYANSVGITNKDTIGKFKKGGILIQISGEDNIGGRWISDIKKLAKEIYKLTRMNIIILYDIWGCENTELLYDKIDTSYLEEYVNLDTYNAILIQRWWRKISPNPKYGIVKT